MVRDFSGDERRCVYITKLRQYSILSLDQVECTGKLADFAPPATDNHYQAPQPVRQKERGMLPKRRQDAAPAYGIRG